MQEMNVAMSSRPFTIFVYILLPALHLAWGNKAEIRAFPSKVVKKGDRVTIRCSYPYNHGGFRLQRMNTDYSDYSDYSDSKATNVYEYNFTVTDVQEDSSAYRCLQVSSARWSEPSDLLTLQVIDFPDGKANKGIGDEEEETTNTDDDAKGKKDTDYGFLIPVVAASCGILILILIVILVVYFIRKNKSSTKKMKNGDFHHSEKAEAITEATYCTVDEKRVRATPDVEVDMRDTTLDSYDDGITYATLNKTSLKEKSTQPDVSAPTDNSLYAEVKKSGPK